MRILLIITVFFAAMFFCKAQNKMFTRTGKVYFISKTSIINIDGTNNRTICFLDTKTGEIAAGMAMKHFEFTLPLAEEHFNENYVESDKYPNAKLSGKINNFDKIDLNEQKTNKVEIIGKLTFHGVTNDIKITGILEIKKDKYIASSEFEINIDDYKIKVPKLVDEKVAKVIPVKVYFELFPHTGK
ncbi:MAG: YceI family protein [Bacteroidales bacterium]|nr:YceI family protein [Bacteroidales bacterium]